MLKKYEIIVLSFQTEFLFKIHVNYFFKILIKKEKCYVIVALNVSP